MVLSLALAPLRPFGLSSVLITTLQALSGAGYPGVASLDVVGNVIPLHRRRGGEDRERDEEESSAGSTRAPSTHPVVVSAQTTRVPVVNGHTESIAVALDARPSIDEVRQALTSVSADRHSAMGSRRAPLNPVVYLTEQNRPQPRLDVDRDGGMTVTVGRLRPCPVLGYKFVALGHNTVRGAAGAAVLNAELMVAEGVLASAARR